MNFLLTLNPAEEDEVAISPPYWFDEKIGNFQIRLDTAETDENEGKITLFATTIWEGSKTLATILLELEDQIKNHSVLEFGAGAGLPSVVSAKLQASRVCASDYPSQPLLDTLNKNFRINEIDNAKIVPHIWGSSVDELISANDGQKYDFVIAAECLWRQDCHSALLHSIEAVIKPTGTLIIGYSHHIPGCEEIDDQFVLMAIQKGFFLKEKRVVHVPHQWNRSISKELFICIFTFQNQTT